MKKGRMNVMAKKIIFQLMALQTVFSSNQPNYMSGQYGGWFVLPINANEVELIICVQSEEKEEFITA